MFCGIGAARQGFSSSHPRLAQILLLSDLLINTLYVHKFSSGYPLPRKMEAEMNLRRLKYFVKIVDIGSLTQAAEVLHIAQPALSQQLATLEGELQQQLLIRTKRGVTPTEAGNILYMHAQTILRQCEQAHSAVNCAGQALSGQLSVGLALGSAAPNMAAQVLQAVREQHPRILLYINENFNSTLAELV